MIVQKPADLDPAMRSALKNHIMRKRQQLKQELEQDAIEKRLKREQEAKRKQDAMTLDQIREQLSQLEKNLGNLKNEKHHLFLQLKQNMRVLNEDDKQRKQKEGEMNAARSQQINHDTNQQDGGTQLPPPPLQATNQQQPPLHQSQPHIPSMPSQQPQQQAAPPLSSNIPPHQPPPSLHQQRQPQHLLQPVPTLHQHNNQMIQQQQQPIHSQVMPLYQPHQQQQSQQQQQQSLQQIHQPPLSSQKNNINNNLNSSTNMSVNGPLNNHVNHAPNSNPNRNLQQSMKDTLSVANLSGDTMSPSKKHHSQPPLPSSQSNQIPTNLTNPYLGFQGLPPGLGGTMGGPPPMQPNLAGQNLIRTPPPPPNMGSLLNSAAFSHLLNAQNFPRQSPYLPQLPPSSRASLPFGHHPMSPYPQLGHHPGIPTSSSNNNAGSNMSITSGGSAGLNSGNLNHAANNPSHNTLLQSMKRPISATNLTSETVSPNKKLHTQPQTPSSQPHQILHPHLVYAGVPPSLQANMFNSNLIRTPPPPPSMGSLFSSAAFSHLFNAQNFPRQSPYLSQLQSNRPMLPFGHHPMSPYSQLGHHTGIPTTLSHGSQNSPMIRPSPPPPPLQIPNSSAQMNSGGHKLHNLPTTSSGQLDFNPNLSTSTAHQMQQQALNNQAVAAAAALGLHIGPPYFNRFP